MNRFMLFSRLLSRSCINSTLLKYPLYNIKRPIPFINNYTHNTWNVINTRQIFTHKRNKFGMVKHWRRKRKKVLIRKSLIPWRPERKSTRPYKMPKERLVFKVGWCKNRRGGRMLKIRRQR